MEPNHPKLKQLLPIYIIVMLLVVTMTAAFSLFTDDWSLSVGLPLVMGAVVMIVALKRIESAEKKAESPAEEREDWW